MNFLKKDLVFLPLGGSEQIGMNANLYHYNNKWILVDLGISFPDETQLGVDVLLPDFDFVKKIKNNLLGIFLTHAHEDHFGAIPYFASEINCPIWGTEFTLALLRRKLKESNVQFSFKLNLIPKKNNICLGDFEIQTVRVPHSIPHAVSFFIKTKSENIFHTGDWKFESSENLKEKSHINVLKNISKAGVTSIVSDSTNALVEGRTPSEYMAYKGLMEVINKKTGCVFITCFSSNISRIKSLITIAGEVNRKICILGRALNRAVDAAIETGLLPKDFETLKIKNLKNVDRKKLLVICAGSQGEVNSALSKISLGKNENVFLKNGDTVIFSSRKIPGNESAILKIEERIIEHGVEIINEENQDVHVSGHPSKEEIIEIYNVLKPKSVIPVHGNRKQLEGNAKLANKCQINKVFIPKNGDVIKVTKSSIELLDKVEIDTKVYDGGSVVSLKDERFVARKHALWNGIISVSIVINEQGEMLSVPKLTQQGISDSKKMGNLLLEISLQIEDLVERLRTFKTIEDHYLENEIKKVIVKEIKKSFFVRPLTNIHINKLQ